MNTVILVPSEYYTLFTLTTFINYPQHIFRFCTSNNERYEIVYLVANECHATVMGPSEVGDGRVAVIDEFDAPATLVFDPHEDDTRRVARRQFLVRLVPLHQCDLWEDREKIIRIILNYAETLIECNRSLFNWRWATALVMRR